MTHIYSLTTKQGKVWAELNVQSKAPSAQSLPRLLEGEPVSGCVKLDLSEETMMKSVTVSVSISPLQEHTILIVGTAYGRTD